MFQGIPTSLNFASEQQWDSSNAWPPLIHMVIEGFRTSGDPAMYEVARQLAVNWLRISYISFSTTNAMFEKYNASSADDASRGQGGEYEVRGAIPPQVLDPFHPPPPVVPPTMASSDGYRGGRGFFRVRVLFRSATKSANNKQSCPICSTRVMGSLGTHQQHH